MAGGVVKASDRAVMPPDGAPLSGLCTKVGRGGALSYPGVSKIFTKNLERASRRKITD